ncbi:unnamed protein product, partial [marine sediment metagenome]
MFKMKTKLLAIVMTLVMISNGAVFVVSAVNNSSDKDTDNIETNSVVDKSDNV